MKVKFGKGKTKFGPGVEINLSGNEVAKAIDAYLVANGAEIYGARTITINGELCSNAEIYIDPSGGVLYKGRGYSGIGYKF